MMVTRDLAQWLRVDSTTKGPWLGNESIHGCMWVLFAAPGKSGPSTENARPCRIREANHQLHFVQGASNRLRATRPAQPEERR